MAQYAYPCRPPGSTDELWYVDREAVDGYGAEVTIVRVKVGDDWRCATVDRSRPLAVDRMLIRSVVASDAEDCPACVVRESSGPTIEFQEMGSPPTEPTSTNTDLQVQAAAISIHGERLIVVAVGIDLVRNPAEADMVIETLSARLGRVPLVLMALNDNGAPAYYGDSRLVDLVAPLPVAKMPWKAYSIGSP